MQEVDPDAQDAVSAVVGKSIDELLKRSWM